MQEECKREVTNVVSLVKVTDNCQVYPFTLNAISLLFASLVAQLDACPSGDQEIAG